MPIRDSLMCGVDEDSTDGGVKDNTDELEDLGHNNFMKEQLGSRVRSVPGAE